MHTNLHKLPANAESTPPNSQTERYGLAAPAGTPEVTHFGILRNFVLTSGKLFNTQRFDDLLASMRKSSEKEYFDLKCSPGAPKTILSPQNEAASLDMLMSTARSPECRLALAAYPDRSIALRDLIIICVSTNESKPNVHELSALYNIACLQDARVKYVHPAKPILASLGLGPTGEYFGIWSTIVYMINRSKKQPSSLQIPASPVKMRKSVMFSPEISPKLVYTASSYAPVPEPEPPVDILSNCVVCFVPSDRSDHFNLCTTCSESDERTTDFCVFEKSARIDFKTRNVSHGPKEFTELARSSGCTIYVVAPEAYDVYYAKGATRSIVFIHQGHRPHVLKAIDLSDLEGEHLAFLAKRPSRLGLRAELKRDLEILVGIANKADADQKFAGTIKKVYPHEDRMKTFDIARRQTENQSGNNKNPRRQQMTKEERDRKAAQGRQSKAPKKATTRPPTRKPPSIPSKATIAAQRKNQPPPPKNQPPPLASAPPAEMQSANWSAAGRRMVKPAHPRQKKSMRAGNLTPSGLETGVTYSVNHQDKFTPRDDYLKGAFEASSYTAASFQKEHTAANWSSSTFQPGFKQQVNTAVGVGDYDIQDVARNYANHLDAGGKMPNRFSDTVSRMIPANGIVTLNDSNFTEGDSVIIVTPNLDAAKGALVFAKSATMTEMTASSLIAVIIPSIDAEELGPLQNVNASRLSVGIQQSTGADSSVSAFSNQAEGAVCAVSPMSSIPGKLAYTTKDKKSLSTMITDQTLVIFNQNYDVPDHLVKVGRAFDKQSVNVNIPGGAARQASAILSTGNSFVITAGAKGTAEDQQYGWTQTASYLCIAASTRVWDLEQHPSYLRHLLYGGLHIDYSLGKLTREDGTTLQNVLVVLQIIYSDGTMIAVNQSHNIDFGVGAETSLTGTFITEGYGIFHESVGKIIIGANFNISFAQDLTLERSAGDYVHFKFDAINAATDYSVVVITGARHAQTIAINLMACVEINLDPTGDVARYLEPDKAMWVDATDMAYFFKMMDMQGAKQYLLTKRGNDAIDYTAGPFGEKIKKFFKKVFKFVAPALAPIGRMLGGALGGPAGAAAGGQIGQAIGSMAAAPIVSEDNLLAICDSYKAATFASSAGSLPTGFMFPIVSTDNSTARLVNVVRGAGVTRSPLFLSVFKHHFAGDDKYTGASCDLAFLLAALANQGAPAIAGVYSGEVRNLAHTKTTATFDLLPVDLTEEKLKVFGADCMLVATAKGLTQYGMLVNFDEADAFMTFARARCHLIAPPTGFPDACYRISLCW